MFEELEGWRCACERAGLVWELVWLRRLNVEDPDDAESEGVW